MSPRVTVQRFFLGMEVHINSWETEVKDWSCPPSQEHLLGLVLVVRVTLILLHGVYDHIHFRVHLE